MKENLLPDMTEVVITDKEGEEATIAVNLVKYKGKSLVFISDCNRYGLSSIARNTLTYLTQIIEGFALDVPSSFFLRHVYTAKSGSVFGRFYVDWRAGAIKSYRFKMLNTLDETHKVLRKAIKEGERVVITHDQLLKVATASV